ncbi:MAG: hypothetical protein EHM79_02015 [Geobacter sp.]|nr:MAG: hypothetical protein EHM79_02015 [Geobacter sp.]
MIVLTIILTMASLVGVVLNIRQNRACFYIWTVTNAAWAVVDFRAGLPAQAALFAIYFGLSVWGIIEWKRKSSHRQPATSAEV